MEKEEIVLKLMEVIKENQKYNGIQHSKIEPHTRPIDGLKMFDSLTAIEVLVALELVFEDEYGIECELDISLFFTDKGRKALNKERSHQSLKIEEIAENIYNKIIRGL